MERHARVVHTMNNFLPPNTDPAMAVRFIRAWYGMETELYMTVSQMAPGVKRMRTKHTHVPPAEAVDLFESSGMDDLVYWNDVQWNLYLSVGMMRDLPGSGRKGGKRDVVRVPGVWVDLDVDKAGYFDDEQECLSLLRGLPQEAWPSIVVATGTGGVHAYWKTPVGLDMDEAERLCTMWWAYLDSRTDKRVEKLTNADRLMKLPGSVRWPKHSHDAASLVRLLYCDGDVRTDPRDIERLAQPVWDALQADIAERRGRIHASRLAATQEVSSVSGRWGMLMTLSTIEDDFNMKYSWDDILLPLGWTKMDQDGDGRDIWARPGLSAFELHKSAATDYEGSHVMSLFSDSEETGLAHLLGTGVTLTKYRVYVETVWQGDEAGFVRAYLAGEQGTP